MAEIHVLSSDTINRIAAGEVVERPVNVVKELAENSIDAGATAITVEIKNGGIDLIRVTDNGSGIEPSQITRAFRRHATSKITEADDLVRLHSLGFRGEALSSIAAVSRVEMITKTKDSLVGIRAINDSLSAKAAADPDVTPLEITEIGAPDGTTVIVRDLFYNVPVRRKFLKTPQTEAGAVTDLLEHLALSHPDVSFHYRVNHQEKLHTTGNGNIKELIYRIYGREMSNSVIPISAVSEDSTLVLNGFLGRPEFSRSSRNGEIFFVNGRILKSDVLSRGLEEGYRTDLMQHRFPFAVLYLRLPAEETDVNVHPSKMEVRFQRAARIFDFLNESVHQALHRIELIPRATLDTQAEENRKRKEEERQRQLAEKNQVHQEPFERAEKSQAPHQEPLERAEKNVLPAGAIRAAEPPQGSLCSSAENGKGGDALEQAAGAGQSDAKQITAAPEEKKVRRYEEDGFVFTDKTDSAASASASASPLSADERKSSKKETAPSEKEAIRSQAASPSMVAEKKGRYEQASFIEEAPLPDPSQSKELDQKREALALSGDLEAMFRESVRNDFAEDLYGNREYHILTQDHAAQYQIVGQIFDTYWIVAFQDKMLMIDQHAAHEKVNFERLMRRLSKEQEEPAPSQMLAPPIILNLTGKEEAALAEYMDYFVRMGYELEPFGENSYAIRGVPMELYANEPDALLREILDEILDSKMSGTPAAILYKIASMSCKAAVKGNMRQSTEEAKALIEELLSLDNPYHCPHGRPTMIVLSKQEIERKFKRIV